VEAARPSVTHLDTLRHIQQQNNIPGRRRNSLKFRSYKCLFLFTEIKPVRSIVYFQYSVFLFTSYVTDKMSSSPVTSLQRLKVTVAVKEGNLYKQLNGGLDGRRNADTVKKNLMFAGQRIIVITEE